eukprot:5418717-Lingulodinium_polyedra.AAC.1
MIAAVAEAFALATAFQWRVLQRVHAPAISPDNALAIGAAEQSLNDASLGSPAPLLAAMRARVPGATIQH